MPEASRGWLLRKRNILGAALVAGIGLGIYLGKLQFGFGLGNGFGTSTNQVKKGDADDSGDTPAAPPAEPTQASIDQGELPITIPKVVKVLIDDREFLLRRADADTPITLRNLVDLIKQAPGDSDGFKVRIYAKPTARVSAEEDLKQALVDASIPDTAVFWVPLPVNDTDTRRSDLRKNK